MNGEYIREKNTGKVFPILMLTGFLLIQRGTNGLVRTVILPDILLLNTTIQTGMFLPEMTIGQTVLLLLLSRKIYMEISGCVLWEAMKTGYTGMME